MISTKGIQILPLSKENILLFLTDEIIFRKYINRNFRIGEVFNSPLRPGGDPHPSFGIYYNTFLNKLMYKDQGGGGDGGDCFKFIMRLYNDTFWGACNRINRDFNLNLGGKSYNIHDIKAINTELNIKKVKKDIKFEKRQWSLTDELYWSQYGISLKTLDFFNVHAVNRYWSDGKLLRYYTEKYPIYAYYFPRTGNKKIYVPNDVFPNKWYSNANNNWDIQGYDQLPEKGDLCIITKSMKDVMCLYELGYNSVATHAEGNYINPDFISHLKERFKQVIFFYDNDKTGIVSAEKMSVLYECEYIYIPIKYSEKDISDFYKNQGELNTIKLIKELINECRNIKTIT